MSTVARRFILSTITVKSLVQLQQQTGDIAPHPIPGGVQRIGSDQEAVLRARLETEPDTTVLEQRTWRAEHQDEVLS